MNDPLYRQLLQELDASLEILPDKPDETPEATLACLWAAAGGEPLAISQSARALLRPMQPPEFDHLRTLVERRLQGVPLAHLTGRQDFMGLVLLASPAALVPRKETEILAEAAISCARNCRTTHPLVVDLCTGAGNVALAVATHASGARVHGSDISQDAVDLARLNAAFLGREDVDFAVGDLAAPFQGEDFLGHVDVVTCNPPYISSTKVGTMHREISEHEPRAAFDGGAFGVRIIQRLIQDAPALLRPGGWLIFEVGLGQGDALQKRLERLDAFDLVEAFADQAGAIRTLAARRTAVH